MKSLSQSYINHVVLVLDKSYSMLNRKNDLIQAVDAQIEQLARRSKEVDQETRVSIYVFDERVECVVYDKDVLRLPSIRELYNIGGNTALIDASLKAIEDLGKTPELYGDHAFLMYVFTDGEENRSKNVARTLASTIERLSDNWTVAAFVPNQKGVFEAKKYGFPAGNISVWSADTSEGIEDGFLVATQATDRYFQARSTGIRSTKSLFDLKVNNLTTSKVAMNLDQLSPKEFKIVPVTRDYSIREFVETRARLPYVIGNSFYQLTKPEAIQSRKQICVRRKNTDKVYAGSNARKMLGLPDYEIKVSPLNYSDFDIFVQSTSVNRKLVAGTELLVLR